MIIRSLTTTALKARNTETGEKLIFGVDIELERFNRNGLEVSIIDIDGYFKNDASEDKYRPHYCSRPLNSGEGIMTQADSDRDYLSSGFIKLEGKYYSFYENIPEILTLTEMEVAEDDSKLITIEEWKANLEEFKANN
jgi:hypothetical protein